MATRRSLRSLHLCLLLTLAAAACDACRNTREPPASIASTKPSPSASGDPLLGHHELTFDALPPPYATPSAENPPKVIARPEGASLRVPAGFSIAPYAEGGFERPRWLGLAPNGDVLVADSDAGKVVLLRGLDGEGRARERFTLLESLKQPFGLAVGDGVLFVGDTDAVLRFPYAPGQTRIDVEGTRILELPGRGYHEHWTRNVVLAPDRQRLFVTIGSESNVEPEADPLRASIVELRLDTMASRIFASGTRNPIGLAFEPTTRALWANVQERDELGDDLVPDYLASIDDGAFYGWPYAYLGPHEDPRRARERSELVVKTRAPEVLFQAHSAVLGLLFYRGAMFPEEFRGDALVAFHGSWNRAKRTGYELVRVPFEGGAPTGGYDELVSGWMLSEDREEVWGRPTGLLELADGSVLIVDDGADMIWRLTYARP